MRPRHFAGESGKTQAGLPYRAEASMRPRHFAGESLGLEKTIIPRISRFNEAPAFRRGKSFGFINTMSIILPASMRPRHFAGESGQSLRGKRSRFPASMRPRHFAGESSISKLYFDCSTRCFNEAPAFRRGKCHYVTGRVWCSDRLQ